MRSFSRLLVFAFASLALAVSARAQDVTPTADNRLYRPIPTAAGNPSTGQFGGFAPVASAAVSATGVNRPTSGTLQLRVSRFGAAFSVAAPEFFLGDIIGLPISTFTDTLSRPVALRREPIRATEAAFKYRLPGSSTTLTFTPSTAVLGERYFWSQHARFATVPNTTGTFERLAVGAEAGTLRDGFIYASQSGGTRIYWRTESPVAIEAGTNAPIYGLLDRSIVTASASRLPVRRIFWTEQGFQGQAVIVPKGDIQQVRVAYNDAVPELVPVGQEYLTPGIVRDANSVPLPRFTLFYDNQLSSLRAYNRQGRVMVEFLGEIRNASSGLRRQVGVEIVDIIQEAAPVLVQVPIGERLYPLTPETAANQVYPLPADGVLRSQALARADDQLAAYFPSPVISLGSLGVGFTGEFIVEGQNALYAQRATTSASDVQIYWQETGLANIRWPRFLNRYNQYWPADLDDYAVNVRPSDSAQVGATLPIFGQASNFQLVYQDDPTSTQARVTEATGFEVGLSGGDSVNRSLLLFQTSDGGFWYVRVESVLDTQLVDPRYADYYRDTEPTTPLLPGEGVLANVGERLLPPSGADSVAGFVDLTQGDAFDQSAYVNPFTAGIPAAERGAIIPVNAAPRGSLNKDRLAVWWFRKLSPPNHLAGKVAPIYWPSYYTRYRLQWPLNAPRIVLASNAGSGDLPADAAAGSIYTQNNPALPGYNPNEEHAQMITGRAYALRDDLNSPATTSDDYVLVRFTSAADQRPAMRTYRVFREDGPYTFNYDAKAGTVLQAPLPLAIMPLPLLPDGTSRNLEVTPDETDPALNVNLADLGECAYYNRFTFEDRKGLKWIYRGQHNPTETPPALGMKFYYPTQPGFAYPNAATGVDNAPAVGTLTPFLWDGTNGDRVTGTSITVAFKPYWPDLMPQVADRSEVPALQFAETLVTPKFGLPGLDGASSAKILYQQSLGLNFASGKPSAVLHDATRRKVTLLSPSGLASLPASIATSTSQGRTYFQRLPAHLQTRFFFDPTLGEGIPARGGLVLLGEYKKEVVGESYLLPNLLSAPDLAALQGLVASSDAQAPAWRQAILNLSTTLETFIENPAVPGTYIPDSQANVTFGQSQPVLVTSDDQAVDSYALTAVGGGSGYVTLLLGNGRAFTDQSEPVQVQILRVGPTDLYRGQVKPLTAPNPLAEDLTLQHTGDFGGRVQDFEFEWYYSPPVDGQPPANLPGQPGTAWFLNPGDGPRLALGGTQPLLTLTDNYYVMRYRPKVGHFLRPAANTWDATQGWSQWTAPALAEGWIKRVLAGINPYNQRLSDFFNNAINTDVSLLTQAGKRWEGDIPLTLQAAQDAGLIEIYETVLRRGISFTIDGTPPFDYGPANDALLLASGYLNDLYMALGNEAYADAANPIISADSGTTSTFGVATARFGFEGQVPTLLDEELTLLRGRDDFLVPGATTAPVYNRFFWNYTRGINAGEVIYALNYNIRERPGVASDGKIDAADAARQFPQGHGDAYGHYLTAVTNYYRLLSNSNFTWTPRVEAVNILGVPVTVDYQDERKLATAAVSLGRTATRILDLERRKLPSGEAAAWSGLRESKFNSSTQRTRSWGVEQWASRAAQGNFIHWAVVNSLLPENDLYHEGIQKIDRRSVPEINELVALGEGIQSQMDAANRRANALDLSSDSVLFDLSPTQVTAGLTHFDQVLARAKLALANANTAYARTTDQNNLLRSVENQAADYAYTVAAQERAYTNTLIDYYGRPYAGDIGPGKVYPQGYDGPDFFKFIYIDRPYIYQPEVLFGTSPQTGTYLLPLKSSEYNAAIEAFDGGIDYAQRLNRTFFDNQTNPDETINITFTYDRNAGPYQIAPTTWGRRASTGKVQAALLRVMNARENLTGKLNSLTGNGNDSVTSAVEDFGYAIKKFDADLNARTRIRALESTYEASALLVKKLIAANKLANDLTEKAAKTVDDVAEAAKEALPTVVGLANDATSAGRAALLTAKVAGNKGVEISDSAKKVASFLAKLGDDIASLAKDEAVIELEWQMDNRDAVEDLREAYSHIFRDIVELDKANKDLIDALNQYQNVLQEALRVQAEREVFRMRAATIVQGARTRDVAFRAFRTESLEQYKTLYDQAARYVFLAAQAYDYETTQLGTSAGRDFLAGIVATRALGVVGANGEPSFGPSGYGDPGLSSYLAKLQSDWNVAKGRLGINNPDQYGTLFSLRRELLNLAYREDGTVEDDTAWQDRLRASYVADIRNDADVGKHALPLSNPNNLPQPGFIITFSTDIETGKNFFGNELRAGDSAYSSASYSTKINSVGVAFKGYIGMVQGSTLQSPNALSATPYVYLLPAGVDKMRTPPLNGAAVVTRQWAVQDHAMPLPYDIGNGGFGQTTNWNSTTVLSEPFFLPRQHAPFRAVSDANILSGRIPDEFTNRRLVGRSAWNTEWKLVIPANTLLADPIAGRERFIASVKDIKLFLRTYSNAGN